MSGSYVPTSWVDGTTKLGPTNLNKLEDGARDAYTQAHGWFNVKDVAYGAKGDGTTDDTTAIQSAITAAKAANGVCYLPPGTYKITTQLVVGGCRLLGANLDPHTSGTGSVINVTDTSLPAVSLQQGGSIEGVTFFYPNQVTTSVPTIYPATIQCDQNPTNSNAQASLASIRGCRFINSYIAIDTNAVAHNPFIRIEENDICALSIGILHPYSAIETHIRGNRFTPAFWDASTSQPIRTTMSANAVAIQLGNGTNLAGGNWIVGNTVFGYNKGVYFAGDANITTISDNMFDGCCFGIDLSGVSSQAGEVTITGGVIGAVDPWTSTRRGYAVGATFGAGVSSSQITISGVTFEPSHGDQINFTSTGANAMLVVSGCTFGAGRSNDTTTASYGVFVGGVGNSMIVSVSGNTFWDLNNQNSGKMVGVSLSCLGASVTGNVFRWMNKSVDVSGMSVNNRPYTVTGNSAFQTTTQDLYYPTTQGVGRIGFNRWFKGQGGIDESGSGSYTVASAGSMTLPDSHDFITVTGTSGVTGITASWPGRQVMLMFTGAVTVQSIGNLKLNGNYTSSANGTLTLGCDGANWFEIARTP